MHKLVLNSSFREIIVDPAFALYWWAVANTSAAILASGMLGLSF
jgi:hypothetical protein